MKVIQRTVRLELAEPLRISRSTMSAREAVWLTVEHDGVHGHGEAVTSVYYGLDADTLGRRFTAVAADLVRFRDPESALAALRDGESAGAPETPPAVTAAVDSALLDLVGKRAGSPVHRLLGAPSAPVAATARTIGITAPSRAAAEARRLAASGFEVVKVKAGAPDPEDDVERVRVVRDAAPRVRLLLDPNGAWTAAQADALLPRFAQLGVEAVEQPLAPGDPEALAALAERSPLPVIADEDAVSPEDVRRLAGRVHGVNVKLAKCGGVHAALRIAESIEGSGTELMLGCLTASSLGLAPAVHLADRARWVDLDGHLLLAHDPWTGIGGDDGFVRTTDLPGLGVRPREEARGEDVA
ncbi:dipeptide epimerase [Streptomyces ipomoeae]|uniref:Dipeptide epimerase n=2 Tax=Streptomyces ipomoeae TaxID=103232 RepID=L1KN97_9ACTN|nr:dipeptide epimerase [Streptomyces ipomoeae]EKX62034.1 mandelate racemase/muconate lactonizing enzyme, C-terminal domain protein [Streptomyces ipomoeae 91-03]MDX2692482.1 dipeptide epimerase [Streptomyces ipomoeae]MDX2838177.1 dipeptide epimerase [Streptomyces ipomoeae]TQE37923.1 dipeptide epimerase [Streptomyces ipomoeae]TQE38273.1 dipeptide epimerase [Streptomyces ipomoeae]